MELAIRPAVDSDEAALGAIDHATWSPVTTPAPRPPADAAFFEPGRVPADVFVAEGLDGMLIGYVLVGRGHPMPTHAHVAFLRGLAVDPDRQGRGVARELVRAALDELARRGITRVRSNVLSTNPASLAVHRACGFIQEGRLVGEFVVEGTLVDDVLLAAIPT